MLKEGRWLDSRRLDIAVRTVLGVGGGYAMSALLAASLSLALPLTRSDAVMAATMLAFLVYCALIIWAYAAASVPRLVVIWAVLAGLLALLMRFGGQA